MRKRLLSAALVPFALAACAGGSDAAADRPAPTAVATSPAVTDCGTFTLRQGQTLPDAAARCFVEAVRDGRAVGLNVTRPTIEGDPIPVTYSASADGRVEVVTDSRQDDYGNRVITRQTCTEPTAAPGRLSFGWCSSPR